MSRTEGDQYLNPSHARRYRGNRRRGKDVSTRETPDQAGIEHSPGSPSILSSANGAIEIINAIFNATGRDHINITINNAGTSQEGPPSDTRIRPVQLEDENSPDSTELEDRSRPLPQTSYGIYYKHITPVSGKERGIPLWIVQPDKNLPIEYQRTGARIGDVGIITSRGNFIYLFNICHPADHPINFNRTPNNFKPLKVDPTIDIQAHSEGPASYLSSKSVKKSNRDGNPNGLVFESSASQGAILTMPVGLNSEDLLPVRRFEKYANQHAEDWYKHVINVRECEISNGDIRLVRGHDKTFAWGMATFSNPIEQNHSVYLSFQLTNHSTDTAVERIYGWEYSGMAEVRTGPDPQEVETLRRGDPSQEGLTYENQCLFIRTIKVKLPDEIWRSLASEFGKVDVEAKDGPSSSKDLTALAHDLGKQAKI